MAAERIFLIGMMGSGKSHWLKQMAKWNKSVGYDLDALIEMNEEKTIAEIISLIDDKKGTKAKGLEIDSSMFRVSNSFALGAAVVIVMLTGLYAYFW